MAREDRARRRSGHPPTRAKRAGAAVHALTRRGRQTRDNLVVAAQDIFRRFSFDEVRVTDITTRAGVASGTFYTYFDSKEEIFREVAGQALAEMSAAPRRGPANEKVERDPVRDIEQATRRYFDCVRSNARIARSIEELHMREPGVGTVRRDTLLEGVKRIERWIRWLQDRGICDPQLEAWPTALALHAMNVSVAYDHLVYRDAPEETETLVGATTRIWCATVGLES